MTMKMQTEINNLEAHYNELDQRMATMEQEMDAMYTALQSVTGGMGRSMGKLKIVKEDKIPVRKTRNK